MRWGLPLSRPVEVTDRAQPLATLRDAGDYIAASFGAVTHDQALVATVELLMAAAETGASAKVDAATDQLETFLAAQRRIRSLARAKQGPGWIARELRRRLDGEG
jgi:hypothetical protein